MNDMFRGLMYNEDTEELYLVSTTLAFDTGKWETAIALIDYDEVARHFTYDQLADLTEYSIYLITESDSWHDVRGEWIVIGQYKDKRTAMLGHAALCNFYVA